MKQPHHVSVPVPLSSMAHVLTAQCTDQGTVFLDVPENTVLTWEQSLEFARAMYAAAIEAMELNAELVKAEMEKAVTEAKEIDDLDKRRV